LMAWYLLYAHAFCRFIHFQLQQQKYMQYQQQQQQMMRQAPQNAAKTVRAALQEAAVAHGAGDVARGSGGGRSIAGVLAGFLCAEDAKARCMYLANYFLPTRDESHVVLTCRCCRCS